MQGFPSREEEDVLKKQKQDALEEKLEAIAKTFVKLSNDSPYEHLLQKAREQYNGLIRAFYHEKIEDMEKDMRKVKDILNELLNQKLTQ